MAIDFFKSSVSFINDLGNSGPAITEGIHQAVAVTNGVAQSAHEMAQETTETVNAVELALKEGIASIPEVVDNLNATLIRLEWALSVVYYVTIALMLLCIFHCLFSVWVALMHIYAAKKVDIVKGTIPDQFNFDEANQNQAR